MQTILTLVGITLFIVAAYNDFKTFRVPNILVAAVALLGVTCLIVNGDPSIALYTVGASAALLVVGFLLFWQGIVGGGDAKLITAATLLVGYHDLFGFLASMAIAGAVISLVALVMQWLSKQVVVASPDQPQPKAKLYVPYGVAIAAAGGVTLFFQSPFLSSFIR